jgi:hypothetical protein
LLLVWGLVGAAAVYGLSAAGFEFRWDRLSLAGTSGTRGVAPDPPGGSVRFRPQRSSAPDAGRSTNGAAAAATPVPTEPRPPARRESDGAVVIDFETFPDGSSVCSPCPVRNEYGSRGVLLSFHSWTANARGPYLVDAASYRPTDTRDHALGSALQEVGFEVGVIRMDFPDRPSRVEFDLTGSEVVQEFQVIAWAGGRRLPAEAILRSGAQAYNASGGGRFRREVITVQSPAGIDWIELDGWGPPGHLLLVDNLRAEYRRTGDGSTP